MGTDRKERWSIEAFKRYARPHFDAGRSWTYRVVERHIMGDADIRWFDEVLWNEQYGHCRGTGTAVNTKAGWRIAHYSLTFLIPNEEAAAVGAITRKHQFLTK